MRYVILILLFFALILTTSADNAGNKAVPFYIYNAASTFHVDAALMMAICSVESRCKANALNRNDANRAGKALGKKEHSCGLFQMKLATARALGFTGTKKQLMDPQTNSYYAAKLLRELYDRYENTEKAISAYNAGVFTKSNKHYVDLVLRQYVYFKIDRGI